MKNIALYHPNKKITGFACSFQISDDTILYSQFLKQDGWDEKNDNGTFKGSKGNPEKSVSIKLSATEAAGIVDCIERNRPFAQYHDNDKTPKNISFSPWMSKEWTDSEGTVRPAKHQGFSFSVLVTDKSDPTVKNAFYIGLTFAEARLLREFLITYMQESFENRAPAKYNKPANQEAQSESTDKSDDLTGF